MNLSSNLNAGVEDDPGSLNPKKWNELYSDYLYNYARNKINDEDLAKDLVQDTFLTAFEQMPNFGYRSTEKTWLVGILRIKILLIYRRRANEKIFSCSRLPCCMLNKGCGINLETQINAISIEMSEHMDRKELQHIICKAVLELPDLWRAVFVFKYVDDQNSEYICTALKLTRTQYWMICHRMRVGLQLRLNKAGWER